MTISRDESFDQSFVHGSKADSLMSSPIDFAYHRVAHRN